MVISACSSPEVQKKRHFEQGNTYAAQKRDDFAVIEYANAVRIDPKFGEARLKLAETYERMGNVQAAFPEFIRAADALPDNRDAQLKATALLLLARRFEDAKTRASAMLAKNPKDVQALIARANAMAGMKDVPGAIEEIEEAQKIAPGDSNVFVSRAAIQQQSGSAKEAEASFRQALTLDPKSVSAHLAFGNFLLATGRLAEAEQEIKQSVTLDPKNAMANRLLASLYLGTGRRNLAEQPLKVVAATSPAPAPKFELADYYVSAGRDEEAKKLLTTLASGQDTFARAEGMLAALDYQRGRTKEAHARVDKLLARVPKESMVLEMKARWLTSEQKLEQALEVAKAAVAADSRSALAHYTLGVVHSLRGNTSDAAAAYTEALRLNPRFVSAQIQLARVNLLRGDRDGALRNAQEATQTAPGNVDARVALARSYLQRNDLQNAEIEVKKLLEQWPNVADVHSVNGTLLAVRNKNAEARAAFIRALELMPSHLDAFGGLVALDLKEKRFGDAIARVDQAIASSPNRAELLALGGTVYDQAGQKDKAEQAMRRAIEADPKSSGGYTMLGQFYLKQNRLDDARAQFETLVKQDPAGAVGARTMIGMIFEQQGKREEARAAYQAAVADNPSLAPIAANNLAFMYAEDGANLDVALNLASNAKKALPELADVDDTLGWVYYKKGLWSLAISSFEDSLKRKPDSGAALYHLGLAYAKLGDTAKSRQALERALKLKLRPADAATAKQMLANPSK